MNGIPLLTLITVLPAVGAAIALFSGRHARAVAIVTTLAGLALALVVWSSCPRMGRLDWWSSTFGRRRWALNITWASTGWAR